MRFISIFLLDITVANEEVWVFRGGKIRFDNQLRDRMQGLRAVDDCVSHKVPAGAGSRIRTLASSGYRVIGLLQLFL
jgi:hypothetical protein